MWTQGSTLLARGRNLGSVINLQCYAMHHPQACMQGIQTVLNDVPMLQKVQSAALMLALLQGAGEQPSGHMEAAAAGVR